MQYSFVHLRVTHQLYVKLTILQRETKGTFQGLFRVSEIRGLCAILGVSPGFVQSRRGSWSAIDLQRACNNLTRMQNGDRRLDALACEHLRKHHKWNGEDPIFVGVFRPDDKLIIQYAVDKQ
jgi:hypothetical protein